MIVRLAEPALLRDLQGFLARQGFVAMRVDRQTLRAVYVDASDAAHAAAILHAAAAVWGRERRMTAYVNDGLTQHV